jgi:2-methylcitrate dehydratase
MAVAIIDGEVTPRQYEAERIKRDDVQELLKKVHVQTQMHVGRKAFEVLDTYTQKYPEEMPCKIVVRLKDGRELECEKTDYYGFYTRPMSRQAIIKKFESLAEPYTDASLRQEIEDTVHDLEDIKVADLTRLLPQVRSKE